MAQQRLKFNDYTPPNVTDDGYTINFATTSTQNSGRTMRGVMNNVPLFTVESYNLRWANLPTADVSAILTQVMGKSGFNFYHYNIYKARWETGVFYAANFNSPALSLKEGNEKVKELTFQVTGVNPV